MIKQLHTKTVYENKWMKVREDAVEFESGSQGIFGVVEKPDFAMVIPFDGNGFYLVKQYRYAVSESYWEFPQGSYESNPDLDPQILAKNELKEETGLDASEIKEIGYLYEAYGYCNQGFHIFLATNFKKGTQQLESSEQDMVCSYFSINEFEQMIKSGEIKDAPTISAYGLLKVHNIL